MSPASLSRLLPVLLLLCAALPGQGGTADADAARSWFVREMGGGDGAPGFRIWFDRIGASVRRVELLDHTRPRLDSGEERAYPLVIEELFDPRDPGQGIDVWLRLREAADSGRPRFAEPLDTARWELVEDGVDRDAVTFRYDVGEADFIVEKTFAYDGGGRRDLRIEIALQARDGEAPDDAGRRLYFDLDGVALFTPKSESLYGTPTMAIGRSVASDGTAEVEVVRSPSGIPDEIPELASRPQGGHVDFAGSTSRFFGAFLYPADAPAEEGLFRSWMTTGPRRPQADMDAHTVPIPHYRLAVTAPEAAGAVSGLTLRLYMGPKDYSEFDVNPEYQRFDVVVDEALNPACFCSVPGSKTLGAAMIALLDFLHGLLGNWGLAIMGLTVLVRGLLFPVNFRMQKSMRVYGAKMAKLKPKLDEIQQRYKNNPQELQQRMMAFNREHKLFPPVGGCLPILLTMPVYLGLFSAIRISYDLRQQPFFLWIDDLSQPDAAFPIDLGIIDSVNLLPFVYMALMFYLMTRQPLPNDPQQRSIAKMTRFMPIMFGVLLYGYAAGMFVYMITSALFALIEQRVVKKVLGPLQADAAGMPSAPVL